MASHYTHTLEIQLDDKTLEGEIGFNYPTEIKYTQDDEFNMVQRERIQDLLRIVDMLSKCCNEIDHIEIVKK